jgi:hypothetical protein
MPERTESDKLRILIPHWIEHNNEHAQEFRMWSSKAGKAEGDFKAAATHLEAANDALREALIRLGGPIDIQAHSHG